MYKEGAVENHLQIFFQASTIPIFPASLSFPHKIPSFPPLIRKKWETFAELDLEHIVKEQILFRVLDPFDGA